MRKSRTIILKGGLGNQLFQVACALWVKERLNARVYLRRAFMGRSTPMHARGALVDPPMFGLEWSRPFQMGVLGEIASKISSRQSVMEPYELPHICRNRNRQVVEGYFQTQELLEVIRKVMVGPIFGHYTGEEEQEFVAVHIRLNDYLGAKQRSFHGVTDPNWSLRSSLQLAERQGIQRLVIFTDDWRQLTSVASESLLQCFSHDISDDPWKALIRLSRASGIVMANSSFSWWAAVLAHERRTQVPIIFPSPWFRTGSCIERHLRLDSWHEAERDIL